MASRIGGVLYIKIDGDTIALEGAGSFRASAVNRESVVGVDGQVDYRETPTSGMISFTAKLVPELDIQVLNQRTNVTVQMELANGQQFVLRNAFQTGEIEADAVAGTADVVFEGAIV